MPVYVYECVVHKVFEVQHKMSEELDRCPTCALLNLDTGKPKRLIAGGTNFVLKGGGWADTGYTKK